MKNDFTSCSEQSIVKKGMNFRILSVIKKDEISVVLTNIKSNCTQTVDTGANKSLIWHIQAEEHR